MRAQRGAQRPGHAVLLRPGREPPGQQLRRHLGLDQVLGLRRALAHGLGGRRPARDGHQRGVGPGAADQRLRGAVGRLDQAELPLQPGEGQHAVLAQGGRELLRRQAVDLVAAVGDEVEDEAHLPELGRELAHLVVAHPGGVPVERGREVVGQHLVREDGVDGVGELPGVGEVGGLGLHPEQVGEGRRGERLGDRVVDAAADLVVAVRRLGVLGVPGDVEPHLRRLRAGVVPRRGRGERAATPRWSSRAGSPRRRGRPSRRRRPRRRSSGPPPPARPRRSGRPPCRAPPRRRPRWPENRCAVWSMTAARPARSSQASAAAYSSSDIA